MSMDTEASLKQYLSLQLRLPLVARVGPLAKMFDFVAIRRPGGQRDRHRGQAVLGGQGTPLRHGHRRRLRQRSYREPAGCARRPSTSWCRSGRSASRPAGCSTSSTIRPLTGLVVVATPAEMPVSETLELTARLRQETKVDLAAVVVNRVLPELFGRGEEEVFARLVDARGATLPRRRRSAVRPASLMEAARLTVTMRRSRTEYLETLRAAVDPSVPLLYVPVPLLPQPRSAGDPPTRRRPFRGAGLLMAGRAERRAGISRAARDAGGPFRGQGDRDRLWFGRRRQDHDRGGCGGHGRDSPRRQGAGGHRRPGPRLAAALGLEGFGNVEKQVPADAFKSSGVRPRGELWAAMLDTKQSWDDLVRRHAPDRAHGGPDPGQPALSEHLRAVRPEPRLHRHGAAVRDSIPKATST